VIVLIASLVLFTPFVLASPIGHIRNAFVLIGLWWGGFGVITLLLLREAGAPSRRGGLGTAARHAWRELSTTVKHISRYPETMKFLLAFLLYNDGIATLISNVTPYAMQNIYVDASLTQRIGTSHLILAIVLVQAMAFPGSLFFGWLAGRAGPKATILSTLAVFVAVVTYGQVARVLSEFYVMAGAAGWVLGGSQAISRGLFASFVPPGKNAEFFAFFALSDRASAMLGPLVYGTLLVATGNTRLTLLSLSLFFAAGALTLWFVDVERGRRQARAG
jgi:UMF1 family MFS transporter